MPRKKSHKDFFISYTKADGAWAQWIAWTLEAAGYTTTIQAWDIRPGMNFVVEMNTALEESKQIVLVLSKDYLRSGFATSEWVAGFVEDPRGKSRRLLPVRVGKSRAHPLLKALVYTDLVGATEEEARQRLLGALPSRVKPEGPPAFPGSKPSFPGSAASATTATPSNGEDTGQVADALFRSVVQREPAEMPRGHYAEVARLLSSGKLIPFLGLGVHFEVTDEAWGADWSPESEFFPSTREYGNFLAQFLSEKERVETGMELARVYQFLNETKGPVFVQDMVHRLFRKGYPAKTAHAFLAGANAVLRGSGGGKAIPLIVTTNLDDVLEATFEKAGEPFGVMSYVSKGENRGRLLFRTSRGETQVLKTGAQVLKAAKTEPTIILKLHGSIERRDSDYESMVLTEDDFVNYFASPAANELVAELIISRVGTPRFLFMGYSLRDWNVRFLLARLWSRRAPELSWAVLYNATSVTATLWGKRGIEILDVPIETHLAGVARQLEGPATSSIARPPGR